jgi:hypothetical protein
MALLNYTTTVSVDRTAGQIQAMLTTAGARAIVHTYNDAGSQDGLSFAIDTPYGRQTYSLPVDAERVRAVLLRQKVGDRYTSPEHAECVAWRILKDWMAAQLAIIETGMVGLDQVMLPYAHTDNGGTTVYQRYVEQRESAALSGGSQTRESSRGWSQ